MEFKRVETSESALSECSSLLLKCFPKATHLDTEYLAWLYRDNPDGEVVGFNAYENGILAAHYSCIPAQLSIRSSPIRGLLSLNTATHPNFQGRGLFTKLAKLTYEAGKKEGYECVYGIANANSTPGFTRKLGFQLLRQLEARIGFGGLRADWDNAKATSSFRRAWPDNALQWRNANPKNPLSSHSWRDGIIQITGDAIAPLISAYGEVLTEGPCSLKSTGISNGAKLFIGAFPKKICHFPTYFSIPRMFWPSPLNFIFRSLNDDLKIPNPDDLLISFIDFDAY